MTRSRSAATRTSRYSYRAWSETPSRRDLARERINPPQCGTKIDLIGVAQRAPALSAVLRGYRRALAANDEATAEGLLAWLGGQPHVAAAVKRFTGIRGDLDHDGALALLAGMLTILRGAGYSGLVLVLDEVETLQRVRSDARDRALNALRHLIDEIDHVTSGRSAG